MFLPPPDFVWGIRAKRRRCGSRSGYELAAAEALPAGRFGRRRVVEGPQAGGVRTPSASKTARPAAGALLLQGGNLATFLREFSAGITPPIGNANSGEVSTESLRAI